jgi:hypothetical protein
MRSLASAVRARSRSQRSRSGAMLLVDATLQLIRELADRGASAPATRPPRA